MKVAYRAYDKAGREVADIIDAGGLIEAGEHLRRQGLFVLELAEGGARGLGRKAGDGEDTKSVAMFGAGRRLRDMSMFTRQLSVLISTGTPMVEAITALERQLAPGEWRRTVEDIRHRVEEGAFFSAALESYPRFFDPVARSLIAAGESGGQLDAMLKRLAALTRQQLKVRSSITGALVYPALLIVVSIVVLIAMMFFVLPRFEDLFKTLGAALPPTTQLLIDLSKFLRGYWWAVLPFIPVVIVCAVVYLGSKGGRIATNRAMVRMPQIGRITRSFATARIARVLGVLLEGRVPLLDALRLTRESTGNICYSELMEKAEHAVERGENISSVFDTPDGSRLINKSVTEAIRSGERTGQMAPVLLNIADFVDEDNEVVLRSLASIIEPVILIVLGLFVGFVAISMFLPLFDLTTATQTGGGG